MTTSITLWFQLWGAGVGDVLWCGGDLGGMGDAGVKGVMLGKKVPGPDRMEH